MANVPAFNRESISVGPTGSDACRQGLFEVPRPRFVLLSLRVDLFDAFQGRQLLDGFPAFFFGQPNFVKALKIQPELWGRSEKMTQA